MSSDAGPNSGGTFASDSSNGGSPAWTNPGNAAASDNSYATAVVPPDGFSEYLKVTNFGFAIPGGATIVGIETQIERKASAANELNTASLFLVKGGTIQDAADDKGGAATWTTSDATDTQGADGDLWGNTWAVSDINNSNFGLAFYVGDSGGSGGTASIDHVKITIYYTGGSSGGLKRFGGDLDGIGGVGSGRFNPRLS